MSPRLAVSVSFLSHVAAAAAATSAAATVFISCMLKRYKIVQGSDIRLLLSLPWHVSIWTVAKYTARKVVQLYILWRNKPIIMSNANSLFLLLDACCSFLSLLSHLEQRNRLIALPVKQKTTEKTVMTSDAPTDSYYIKLLFLSIAGCNK
jgi:hypothetical protein